MVWRSNQSSTRIKAGTNIHRPCIQWEFSSCGTSSAMSQPLCSSSAKLKLYSNWQNTLWSQTTEVRRVQKILGTSKHLTTLCRVRTLRRSMSDSHLTGWAGPKTGTCVLEKLQTVHRGGEICMWITQNFEPCANEHQCAWLLKTSAFTIKTYTATGKFPHTTKSFLSNKSSGTLQNTQTCKIIGFKKIIRLSKYSWI